MAEWRGRALAYPAVVIAGWITGRTFALIGAVAPSAAMLPAQTLPPAVRVDAIMQPALPHYRDAAQTQTGSGRLSLPPRMHLPAQTVVAADLLAEPRILSVQASKTVDADAEKARATPFASVYRVMDNGQRFSAYGYAFWRPDGGRAGVAAPGQYGGSQAAIQFAYDLSGKTDRGLALHGRASFAPDGNQKELALGLRWNRPARLPFTVIAERRLDPDGADRWAAFVAGGFDPQPLPLGFALDGYAQAGWVGGREDTGFFDAQARAMRPVLALGETQIKAGAGVWAGGEDDAQRLDIGPALAAAIPLGKSRIDLRLDWRQRIAGSARPGSGPAVTIATGF